MQRFGSDLGALLDHRFGRPQHGHTTHLRRARAAGAAAEFDDVGIALNQTQPFDVHAERLRGDLRVGRGVALAVGIGADDQINASLAIDDHPRFLLRPAATRFHVAAKADAAQLAGVLTCAASRRKALPIRPFQRHVHGSGELAAGDWHAHVIGIRQIFRANEVAPPQFAAVDAGLPSGGFEESLGNVGRFRSARAPIGGNRHGVSEYTLHPVVGTWRTIDRAANAPAAHGGHERANAGAIGAEIGVGFDLQRADSAIGSKREGASGDVVAAMGIGQKHFRPRAGPLDRTAEVAAGEQADRRLWMQFATHAETAAGIAGNHPHFGGFDFQDARRRTLLRHRTLAGVVERETAVLVTRNRGARFKRPRHHAVVHHRQARHVGCAGDGRIHRLFVAVLPEDGDIVAAFGMDDRCRRRSGSHQIDAGR